MIRQASLDDLDQINDLIVAGKLRTRAQGGWDRGHMPWHTYVVGEPLVATGSIVFRGGLDGDPAGWLLSVVVRPGHRRQGLGAQVVRRLLQVARDHEVAEVWLETLFWNIAFYERMGFAHVPVGGAPACVRRYRTQKRTCLMAWREIVDKPAVIV